MREVVIFDTEFTAWEGSMARQWTGPGEHRELVQIGAVRLDGESLIERAAFMVLVQPTRNPILSSYFVGLTGITQAMVEASGHTCAEALQRFFAFSDDADKFCFGRDDLVLHENLRLNRLEAAWERLAARNIKPWLASVGMSLNGLHSGHLAKAAGADFDGRAHDALADSRSIAAAIRHLVAEGAPNPFLTLDQWSPMLPPLP